MDRLIATNKIQYTNYGCCMNDQFCYEYIKSAQTSYTTHISHKWKDLYSMGRLRLFIRLKSVCVCVCVFVGMQGHQHANIYKNNVCLIERRKTQKFKKCLTA